MGVRVKERPILFSGPMVRAILDGRKTQTRRPIKPQPTQIYTGPCPLVYPNLPAGERLVAKDHWLIDCPFGQPGDRLWVRETFGILTGNGHRTVYRADGDPEQTFYPGEKILGMKWVPSIYMPRSASRITLEITGVRVERLQEITPHDALAEGVDPMHRDECPPTEIAQIKFQKLWDEIYGNWDANPWVWVVEFRRVQS
jgi:hypothetical protein